MQAKCTLAIVLLAVSGIMILAVMFKSKHFFKAVFFSALQGLAALFAVNLLSAVTGFSLAVNAVTLLISALGGTAGVAALLFSRIILLG